MTTYALTVAGTIGIIPLATAAWILTIKEFDRPDQWGNAPLAGAVCVGLVFAPIMLNRIALDGLTVSLRWYVSWTLAGIALAWISQLALEDSLIERHEDVGPAPDRYPDWFEEMLKG